MPDDIYEEHIGGNDPDKDVIEDVAPAGVLICDYVGDDGVCGESFTGKNAAMMRGLHKKKAHGIQGADSARRKTPKAKTGPAKRTREKAPTQRAATVSAGPSTDRAGTYTASLSMAALAAYFALPPFDQTDLDICNAGTPNIGRALAQLAEHNQSVARTCDLILGGGAGGDWIAVIMAIVPVVGAIAAHHGAIPETSGGRFGEMIGVQTIAPTPPPEPKPEAKPEQEMSDVLQRLSGTPETVTTDATAKMMSMGGPIPVTVPFDGTVPQTWAQREAMNGDGERGSEQLRPTVPTAEPEPESAVPA